MKYANTILTVCVVLTGLACGIDSIPLPEQTGDEDTRFDTEQAPEATDEGAAGADPAAEADMGEDGSGSTSTDDASNTPSLNPDGIYYGLQSPTGAILTGVDGAVTGPGTITITAAGNGQSTVATATATGSFVASVPTVTAGTQLDIAFLPDGSESAATEMNLTLLSGSVDANRAGRTLQQEGSYTLTFDANTQMARLEQGDNPDQILDEGIMVILGNAVSGNVSRGFVTADGSFDVQVQAEDGNELVIIAVEPGVSQAGGEPIRVVAAF